MENTYAKKIYSMEVGDRIKIDIFDIWRVPGGWIYGNDSGTGVSFVFVPFDNEFMK